MPLVNHKKIIMGHEYTCTVHTGREGLNLLSQLMSYIGKGSNSLKNISGIELTNLSQLTEDAGIKVIMTLLQMLPEIMDDKFVTFTLNMFAYTLRDGQSLASEHIYDEAFAGNYAELFTALAWVVYVNYCKDLKEVFTKALSQLKGMNLPERLQALSKKSQKD